MVHRNKKVTVALAATGVLLAAGGATALGSAHTPHARAALISTPKLAVTITTTGHGKNAKSTMVVSGPKTVSAGRIDVSLKAVGGEQEVGFVRIKKGHTFKEAAGLYATFGNSFGPTGPSKAGLAALNKVVRIVTFYGGLDSGSFKHDKGSIVLPKAGTYLILNDENGPSQPQKLHVTAKVGNRATPSTGGIAKAVSAKRWRGSLTLPAKGTIEVKNASTNSPHFLVLQHVKEGTTRKQVIDFVQSGSQSNPSFGLPENVDTDVLSEGQAQTITYNLPAGEYVEMCFFPDLQTGMPHAAMGMVRVVHLK